MHKPTLHAYTIPTYRIGYTDYYPSLRGQLLIKHAHACCRSAFWEVMTTVCCPSIGEIARGYVMVDVLFDN